MSGTSPKFKLNKDDLPAIGKSWLTGAGLALIVYTGDFLLTEIDLGAWAALAAMAVPTTITTVKRWWTDWMKAESPVDPPVTP